MTNISIPALQQKFSRLFSSKQLFIGRQSMEASAISGRQPRAVVARQLCVFKRLPFANVPKAKRSKALKYQLDIQSPFVNYGYAVLWQGEYACVWLWDQQSLSERFAQSEATEFTGLQAAYYPETFFAPSPDNEVTGWQWLSVRSGVELLIWQEGQLVLSRWFASKPTGFELQQLKRQYPLEGNEWESQCNWELAPWAGTKEGGGDKLIPVSVTLATMMVGLMVWHGVAAGRAVYDTQRLEAQNDQLQMEIDDVLFARRQAMNAKRDNSLLIDLEPVRQIQLMALVANAKPESATRVQSWEWQNDTVVIGFEDENPDPRVYVSAMESIPAFSNVRAQPDPRGGLMSVQARVLMPRGTHE